MPLTGSCEAAQKLLQVGAAFDEIDVGRVDDEQIAGGIVKEEVFVGAGDFLNVFQRDLRFVFATLFSRCGRGGLRAWPVDK